MYNQLRHFRVLIFDTDTVLADMLKEMLKHMGFHSLQLAHNTRRAMEMLERECPDFLIMDWGVSGAEGADFVAAVRRNVKIANPALPIVLLSRRAEVSDIKLARDTGVNEYIIKPFSAKAIYERLERLVEAPRYYISSKAYTGPDRRTRQMEPPAGRKDGRIARILPKLQPQDPKLLIEAEQPQIWMPNFSMKHKIGQDVTLASIITPAVLNQAQATMDEATAQSAQWIKSDVDILYGLYETLRAMNGSQAVVDEISNASLMVSSRAGTFGYLGASEAAYMLYLFCRNALKYTHASHHAVIEKHLKVIRHIIDNNVRGNNPEIVEVVGALRVLAQRYSK
ncbi:MAG TPA: response regulator [Rickettsiales bacterium]|nr:response regulator [Rickettsiales bacterium]